MKKTKRNKINIIFSSFLVIGYIVCAYFFSTLASQVGGVLGGFIQALILVLFGLLLFYATRVGEGKQVRRFSLAVLLMVVLPSLYIILAGIISSFPLHDLFAPSGDLTSPRLIFALAGVALGYGIPYTFFSGYEIAEEEDVEEVIEEKEKLLEGGLAEELAETEAEDKAEGDSEEQEIKAAEAEAEEIAEEAKEDPAE